MPRAWQMPLHPCPIYSTCRVRHCKILNDMSAAAPNTEFVIYNIPQLAGTGLTMMLKEMLKNPNVVAVKNFPCHAGHPDVQGCRHCRPRRGGTLWCSTAPMSSSFPARHRRRRHRRHLRRHAGAVSGHERPHQLRRSRTRHPVRCRPHHLQNVREAHGNLYAVQKEILRRMYGLERAACASRCPA